MPQAYNCVRISGTLPGGEVWSINPKFAALTGDNVFEYADLLGWANAVKGISTNKILPQTWLQLLSGAGTITQVRTEYYDATGKLTTVAEAAVTPAIAGSASATKTFQTACVLSLRTGRPGRSYRGRLYFPALGANITATTLRLSEADRLALATQGAAFLESIAVAALPYADVNPVVVSQTLGINSRITAVEVGDILDSQRRRRDSVEEGYSQVALNI